MRPDAVRLLAALALATGLALPAAAGSSNGLRADVVVCGSTASEYNHRGTTYIEARDGCEYAIRLSNDSGYRVAVHLSVDRLNTIDASQASPARGPRWVLEPYQQATITGWQTGMDSSRGFYFTTADESYSQWVGDTSDAGQIRVVAYREKRNYSPPPVYIEPGWDGTRRDRGGYEEWESAPGKSKRGDAATGAADADALSSGRAAAESQAWGASPSYRWRDERAATGIGREASSHVTYTSFDAESRSYAKLTLRYGFSDQLVSWGVFPPPYSCRCCGDGFSPDPYDWRCR